MKEVMIPTGISAGETSVLANVSVQFNNKAPPNAEAGIKIL